METSKRTKRVWTFVLLLNFIALAGAAYLKSNGIDLYAFRGGS